MEGRECPKPGHGVDAVSLKGQVVTIEKVYCADRSGVSLPSVLLTFAVTLLL